MRFIDDWSDSMHGLFRPFLFTTRPVAIRYQRFIFDQAEIRYTIEQLYQKDESSIDIVAHTQLQWPLSFFSQDDAISLEQLSSGSFVKCVVAKRTHQGFSRCKDYLSPLRSHHSIIDLHFYCQDRRSLQPGHEMPDFAPSSVKNELCYFMMWLMDLFRSSFRFLVN